MFLTDLISAKYLVIALAYILVGKPASILIALALKRHTDSLQNTLAHSGGETEGASKRFLWGGMPCSYTIFFKNKISCRFPNLQGCLLFLL